MKGGPVFTRSKRSNSRPSHSGGMPSPWSSTHTSTSPWPASLALIRTGPPWGAYLRAFETRLRKSTAWTDRRSAANAGSATTP